MNLVFSSLIFAFDICIADLKLIMTFSAVSMVFIVFIGRERKDIWY